MKFTHSAPELTPFYPWVCLHHPVSVRNLILRCLTGSHMTILSNYRVRLYVNIDIADSISFYFNFGKGHYFVPRLKQHFFDKARFFKNEYTKSCHSWLKRERGRHLRSPLTSRFAPMDLSYPDDSCPGSDVSHPGSDVSHPPSISSYPTLWSIRTQQIMTQNV